MLKLLNFAAITACWCGIFGLALFALVAFGG